MTTQEEKKSAFICSGDNHQSDCDCLSFLSKEVRDKLKKYWVQKVIDADLKVQKAYENYTTYKTYVEEWKQVINNLEKYGDYDTNFTKMLKLKNTKMKKLYWDLTFAISSQQHYNTQLDLINIRLRYFEVAIMLNIDKKKINETVNVIFPNDISPLIEIQHWKKEIELLLFSP
jgi:hypothetical protein